MIDERFDGLYDEPRVGALRKISDADVEAVIVRTLETTPKGQTHWSTRQMAEKAGICKIRDVAGLYIQQPRGRGPFSRSPPAWRRARGGRRMSE